MTPAVLGALCCTAMLVGSAAKKKKLESSLESLGGMEFARQQRAGKKSSMEASSLESLGGKELARQQRAEKKSSLELHMGSSMESSMELSTESSLEFVMAASVESSLEFMLTMGDGVDHTVVESFSNLLAEDSLQNHPEKPEWCENATELTWAQKRQRMQQHETLRWAKGEAKRLRAENQPIPAWMHKMVSDDENRGKQKWAVLEAKRLSAEGQEVPAWMADILKDETRWSHRWAACKAAELRERGEEVPQWMVENGRKGIMDYAEEKVQDLQAQISDLEQEKAKEESLITSNGDLRLARQRMLAGVRAARSRSVEQQFHALEEALAELDDAEQSGHATPAKLHHLTANVESVYAILGRILDHKSSALLAKA